MSRSQERPQRILEQVRLALSPLLLSLAIGALLWQAWAFRHRIDATELTLAGRTTHVRLPMTTQQRDRLVDQWMGTMPPPVDAKFAVMRWRHEVAGIYAERLSATDRPDGSPFRLASAVQSTPIGASASVGSSVAAESNRAAAWRTYWTRQHVGTGEQLTRRADGYRAHLESVADRLLVTGRLWGQTPRPTLAWMAALSIAMGGLWWWTSRRVTARTRCVVVRFGTPDGDAIDTETGWFCVAAPIWYRITKGIVWMLIGGAALALLPNLAC